MLLDQCTQPAVEFRTKITDWSNRRTGVGFDQLLILHFPSDPEVDFDLIIHNADGSESEQCGNGTACVVKYAIEEQISVHDYNVIKTKGGFVKTKVLDACDKRVNSVEISLGEPRCGDGGNVEAQVDVADVGSVPYVYISVGNPHAVVLDIDGRFQSESPEKISDALQKSPQFPDSVNVEFLYPLDRQRARIRIFERGAGETQACGSGSCAAAVAGQLVGLLDQKVKLIQPGGTAEVEWGGIGTEVRLAATASTVYKGVI